VGFLAVRAAEIEEEGNVLIANTENFKEIVEGNDHVLVEFCKLFVVAGKLFAVHFCKQLKPCFENSSILSDNFLSRCSMVWTLQGTGPRI
jgi:hypothetical protein